MNHTIISSDSSCDLFPKLYQNYDIRLMSLFIHMESAFYRDMADLHPDEVFRAVRNTGILPKTSAPSPEDYRLFFEELLQNGEEVVHISLGDQFSSSYHHACMAAEELEHVYVVNTRTISTAMGLLAVKGSELRDKGMRGQKIAWQLMRLRERVRTEFLLDNLEYVKKGGRCSSLTLAGANLLKLRVGLKIKDNGELGPGKKFRGDFERAALAYTNYLLASDDIDPERVFLSHTGLPVELLKKIAGVLNESGRFREILVTRCGCAMSCHSGPGALGIFFLKKEK